MKPSKKIRFALVLLAVFVVSFLSVYYVIFLTQSGHSTPSGGVLQVEGMNLVLGPSPNATDVPVNTAITIEATSTASFSEMQLSPEIPVYRAGGEITGSITFLNTFYPVRLLDSDTTYHVFITISDTPVSWKFTTTTDSFNPGIGFYLSVYNVWISMLIAICLSMVVSLPLKNRFYGD